MYNFFVEESARTGDSFRIDGKDYNHICNVLRMQIGATFLVSCAGTSSLCRLERVEDEAVVAEILEEGGIRVIHDRTLHDYPSYNGSYNHARAAVKDYLEEYPSIRLVLDLHRDASGDNRNQMQTHATADGEDSAQLMLVVGSDASGLTHPQWEENLALALKLHSQLERINPGIMRYVNLRGQRFNQDLSPGMLLVEVGAAGDNHDKALNAAEVLARGIIALAKGCETEANKPTA